jgi:DnaJ-like protein
MGRKANPNKAKKGFLDGYKTYNPIEEGYGSSKDWRNAFKFRLGIDVARETVGNKSPRGILGVSLNASWEEIKAAYKKLVRMVHPDLNPGIDSAKFRAVQSAFEILEQEFGK